MIATRRRFGQRCFTVMFMLSVSVSGISAAQGASLGGVIHGKSDLSGQVFAPGLDPEWGTFETHCATRPASPTTYSPSLPSIPITRLPSGTSPPRPSFSSHSPGPYVSVIPRSTSCGPSYHNLARTGVKGMKDAQLLFIVTALGGLLFLIAAKFFPLSSSARRH